VHSLVDFGLQITGIAVVCAALITVALADGTDQTFPLDNRRVLPEGGGERSI
jgi:hypothetical protein